MSNAPAHRMTDSELEELTRRLNARVPRDASVMAAPSQRVVDITTRRPPLGLSIVDDPGDKPEDDDTPEPEPFVRQDNRPAWLSDIDFLISTALRHERKFVKELWREVWGPVVGQVVAEGDNEVLESVKKALAALEGKPADASEMRSEINQLKLTIGEMKNENQALRSGLGRPPRAEIGVGGVGGRE
jgi:hypothetical protein